MTATQIILNYLRQLKENNNRDWFNERKADFLLVKEAFESLTQQLIDSLQIEDNLIRGIEAKDCVFRIYRDVRFSKDKSPYKTHLGAYITQGGRKGILCGYYLHIEPDASILAGGLYAPSSPVLFEVRDAIYADSEEFKAIVNAPLFEKNFGKMEGEKLKMAPKGFPKDFEDIEILKYKTFLAVHKVADDELVKPDFLNNSLNVYRAMKPFNDFFNRAIQAME